MLGGAGLVLVQVGAIVAALFGVLAVLARRRGRGLLGGPIRPAMPLTASHALHVVSVEGRRLVVGTGPTGAPRLLFELDDEGQTSTARPAPTWDDGR